MFEGSAAAAANARPLSEYQGAPFFKLPTERGCVRKDQPQRLRMRDLYPNIRVPRFLNYGRSAAVSARTSRSGCECETFIR
ncbi:MAG: hypothetical protein K9N48_02815, partial [Verrucomicrobia bacterium]|nr:hypothetical protein [Verrucomicrobiota bacterium]